MFGKETVSIREAIVDDAAAIASLFRELRDEVIDIDRIRSQLATVIDDTSRVTLVIDDTKLVGVAVVNLNFKLPKVEARIDEVIVSTDARGKGYGSMLIEACETWAWDHGADVIELTSRPSRAAANAMYQKLGYQLRETNVYNKKR